MLTRSKDTGLVLFACCSNGDFALTRQSVMPLLYSTCPVDQIYRASVVPSLFGKTEDKEMTEMRVPSQRATVWAMPGHNPPFLNRLTIATKITFSQTQYMHGPRATNTALLHMTLKVTQSLGMIDKTE